MKVTHCVGLDFGHTLCVRIVEPFLGSSCVCSLILPVCSVHHLLKRYYLSLRLCHSDLCCLAL